MLRHIILIISLFFLTSTLVKSQKYNFDDDENETKPTEKYNSGMIIKTAPLLAYWGTVPLTGEYGLALEKKTGLKSSLELKAAYVSKGIFFLSLASSDTAFASYSDISIKGFRGQLDYRYYYNYASKGLYFSPIFSYAKVIFSSAYNPASPYNLTAQHFDFSGVVGYQFIWGRFVMDVFGGITYRHRIWIDNSTGQQQLLTQAEMADLYILNTSVRPRIGFLIGFTF